MQHLDETYFMMQLQAETDIQFQCRFQLKFIQ